MREKAAGGRTAKHASPARHHPGARSAAWDAGRGYHAVYWGPDDSRAVDLNTLIDPASGWELERAIDISDTGWIAGIGQFDPDGPGGQAAYERHFLIEVPGTVPEPGAATAALAFAFGYVTRRRRVSRLDR